MAPVVAVLLGRGAKLRPGVLPQLVTFFKRTAVSAPLPEHFVCHPHHSPFPIAEQLHHSESDRSVHGLLNFDHYPKNSIDG